MAGGDLVISTSGGGLALADGGFAGARTVSAALAWGIITLRLGSHLRRLIAVIAADRRGRQDHRDGRPDVVRRPACCQFPLLGLCMTAARKPCSPPA